MAENGEDTVRSGRGRVVGAVAAVRWLLGSLILVSIVINVANVIARYLFLSPFFWAEQVIIFIMVWCVFLGAALVTWEDRHLNVDIVSSVFPEPFKSLAKVAGALCLLLVAALIIPQSYEATALMLRVDQRTAIGGLPLVVPHSALLVGFVLMAVAGFARVVVLLKRALRPEIRPEGATEVGNARLEAGRQGGSAGVSQ